jgi:hypothetical protein
MNFHNFQSIIGSRKRTFEMKAAMDSFAIASARQAPYIEPSFTKNEFDVEKPQVLLISAVGATGKSTLRAVVVEIAAEVFVEIVTDVFGSVELVMVILLKTSR